MLKDTSMSCSNLRRSVSSANVLHGAWTSSWVVGLGATQTVVREHAALVLFECRGAGRLAGQGLLMP